MRLTRVEILVLVVIAAIGLSLLIPFVTYQRATSRQTACQDRLARLALATQQYDATEGSLPGYVNPLSKDRATGWVIPLLPYLTSTDPKGNDHLLQAHAAMLAEKAGPTRLPELLCPAQGRFAGDAPLSFVSNCGMPDVSDDPNLPPDWQANGLFFNRALPAPQQVKTSLAWLTKHDGTKVTLLFSENVDAGSWRDADEARNGFLWAANVQDGEPSSLPTIWPINQHRGQGDGTIKFARPASEHPGVVNVVMADAKTQALADQIDYLVFQRLMTADGAQVKAPNTNEPLPEPWRYRD
jgi:type II secretory pathway pseudopilin PulG